MKASLSRRRRSWRRRRTQFYCKKEAQKWTALHALLRREGALLVLYHVPEALLFPAMHFCRWEENVLSLRPYSSEQLNLSSHAANRIQCNKTFKKLPKYLWPIYRCIQLEQLHKYLTTSQDQTYARIKWI
jgi:hypothetical protein